MASTSAVSMSIPVTQNRVSLTPSSSFLKPLPVRPSRPIPAIKVAGKFQVRASMKEKVVTGLTAAALTASMVVPEVAQAADSGGLSPSLTNFLLSIAAGGAVLVAILGAIIGVSNFDPVKRT